MMHVDWDKQIREKDLEALEQYRTGRGDAPILYKPCGFVRGVKEGMSPEPMLVFVASEETPDRVGDVIEVAGWQLENFQRNPVLLYAHNPGILPVGTVPRVWVEGSQLLNTVAWDDQDPLALSLKSKYERGIMRAESVGFRPIEFDIQKEGVRFKKQELLEISSVPVPMHPGALRKMMRHGPFTITMPSSFDPAKMAGFGLQADGNSPSPIIINIYGACDITGVDKGAGDLPILPSRPDISQPDIDSVQSVIIALRQQQQ